MITINADLYAISSKLNISVGRLSQYTDKSLDEIIEAEAAQGNLQASGLSKEILSDPAALEKIFKLSDPNNRFAILQNLPERELDNLLPLLSPEDLIMGLNMFTKDKLLDLIGKLPKDELVKYANQMYSNEKLIQMMPEDKIDKVLQSPDLDKSLVLKHLQEVNPEILARMVESVTGKPVQPKYQHTSDIDASSNYAEYDQQALINQISTFSDQKYRDALTSMPQAHKRDFMVEMAKESPKIMQLFDADGYQQILSNKEKPDLVRNAGVISQAQLVKMTQNLPKDLLAMVVTQIDPSVFADLLLKDYKSIISQIVAG